MSQVVFCKTGVCGSAVCLCCFEVLPHVKMLAKHTLVFLETACQALPKKQNNNSNTTKDIMEPLEAECMETECTKVL